MLPSGICESTRCTESNTQKWRDCWWQLDGWCQVGCKMSPVLVCGIILMLPLPQDQAVAESVLGASLVRSPNGLSSPEQAPSSPDVPMSTSPPPFSSEMVLRAHTPSTPNVGTPVRLAPSTSAFRKMNNVGSGTKAAEKVAPGSDGFFAPTPTQAQMNASPSKGIVGQVSDLIFGW